MPNMIFYLKDKKDRKWYICCTCGNKELKQYSFCPVCKNEGENPNPDFRRELANVIRGRQKDAF